MIWAIFDLDGTLADITHRLHFLKDYKSGEGEASKVNWDAFNAACIDDVPKDDIRRLLWTCQDAGMKIAIVTGRMASADIRLKTEIWLQLASIKCDLLFMRREEDERSDWEVKQEFLTTWKANDEDLKIAFIVDDRKAVVDMWRRNGLTCLQCQEGDY